MDVKTLERWDKKFLWHPFTQQYLWDKDPTLIIESGQGVYLKDIRGRKYLDGVSSLWVNLLGHRHPVVTKAIHAQLNKIAHSTFLGLSHKPAIELGKELVSVAPSGLSRVFYSDNGATAVEVALKMAFQYWIEKENRVRAEFLAVKGSYHGDTLGAVSVGGIGSFHSKFKPLLFKTNFSMAPSCASCPANRKNLKVRYRLGERITKIPKPGQMNKETGCKWECLSDAQKILQKKSKKIAAAVIEPVMQGASGMNVMSPGYVAGLKKLCDRYGILLIADEVATGFGRTGTLFACEQEKVRPDFLCVAKALTGGYSPLAATLTTERVFRAFYGPLRTGRTFFHGHSYTGHPLGAAAAVANLKVIKQSKLIEKTRRKAHILSKELKALESLPVVGRISQAGLMAGIELQGFPTSARTGARICKKLLSYGIWMRPLGDVLVIMPPPVISEKDLRRLVRTVRHVLERRVDSTSVLRSTRRGVRSSISS